MSPPANNSNCEVCEGTEYYLDSGFYYCQECHTQSQNVRETAFEETFAPGISRVFKIKNKKLGVKERGESVKWTSWHGYNFILKGLVDELISIGAKPELKVVVLQLWSRYLAKLEAAFISTTEPELPKFSLNQCEKDFYVVYGTKKTRKKKLVKKKKQKTGTSFIDPNSTGLQKSTAVNKMRKAVLKEDYEHIREEIRLTQDVMSQVDERLKQMSQGVFEEDDEERPPVTITYNKEALRIATKRQGKNPKEGTDLNSDADALGIDTDSRSMDYHNPYRLSRLKLVALLVLALNLSKDDIQISDLIRWIVEGHVSYQRVTHLFPSHLEFSHGDALFLQSQADHPTYKSLLMTVSSVAGLLGVDSFPTPDILALARRYVGELRLPSELNVYVERLVASSQGAIGDEEARLMNYEGLAMAYVVMAMKLMFGLDGETEHRISDVAKEINRLPSSETVQNCHNLFVWDDWVCFIECRKAVLVREHFPTRYRLDVSAVTSMEPYVDYLRLNEEKDPNVGSRMTFHSLFAKVTGTLSKKMKWSINQLPEYESVETPSLLFPPTLTPLTAYMEVILNAYRNNDYIPLDVLNKDFTETTIAFLLDPSATVTYAKSKGLHIEVQYSRATEVSDFVPAHKCSRPQMYGPRGNEKVQVYFVDEKDAEVHAAEQDKSTPRQSCKRKNEDDSFRPAKKRRINVLSGRKKLSTLRPFQGIPTDAGHLLLEHVNKRLYGLANLQSTSSAEDDPDWILEESRSKSRNERKVKVEPGFKFTFSNPLNTKTSDEAGGKITSTPKDNVSSEVHSKESVDETNIIHTLYLPHNNYWHFECIGLQAGYYDEFEKDIENNFPESFLWLLKECSRLLEMKTKDLYLQLVSVEKMYFSDKKPPSLKITR